MATVQLYTKAGADAADDVGAGGVASVNGDTGPAVVLDMDDPAETATWKKLAAAERTKLAGIATAATANSSNATLLARANHTGTQSTDTLTDGTTTKVFLATERTKLGLVATTAWTSYTPAIVVGGVTGNASCTGGYSQTGKTVHFWLEILLGSTTTITGALQVSLPVAAKNVNNYAAIMGRLTDAGTAHYAATAFPESSVSTLTIYIEVSSASFVALSATSSTVPFTWTTGDVIQAHGTYEAA